jgi:hypothetical protein
LIDSRKLRGNSLDVSRLPAGNYMLVVESGDSKISGNFIVQ